MAANAKRAAAELARLRQMPANKRCFDCESLGTTYVLPQYSLWVCTTCSGFQ